MKWDKWKETRIVKEQNNRIKVKQDEVLKVWEISYSKKFVQEQSKYEILNNEDDMRNS